MKNEYRGNKILNELEMENHYEIHVLMMAQGQLQIKLGPDWASLNENRFL